MGVVPWQASRYAGLGLGMLASKILQRPWLLEAPRLQLKGVQLQGGAGFQLIQDDLLHPYCGGNKLRKLDAIMPELLHRGVTDVVCCGGVQSAHTAAVACLCAEVGMRAHCIVRGERPAVPSGHLLVAGMFGSVQHVSRGEYADREAMLARHAARVAAEGGADCKVEILEEGAARPAALLGFVRLVHAVASAMPAPPGGWQADPSHAAEDSFTAGEPMCGRRAGSAFTLGSQRCSVVVDSGTGTSAVGMALGAALMQLPWRVHGICLAGDAEYYAAQQHSLVEAFCRQYASGTELLHPGNMADSMQLAWEPRLKPRRFGRVLPGEVARCKQVAARHGVLLDPIYTLAAWEASEQLARQGSCLSTEAGTEQHIDHVILLHTGGALGLQGLAQRHPTEF